MKFFETFWHRYLRQPYRLHVTDHGGDGPTIIFLHGIAASSDKWSELIPLLQEDYRCITIDLVGFGKSPKPQWYGYTMDDHLSAIRKTIRGLRLQDQFALAGHSLGSLLATRYVSVWPEEVSNLLLFSPPVYESLDTIAKIASKAARARNQFLLKLYKFLRTYPRMTPENFKRLSYVMPLPKSVIKHPETWIPFHRTLEHCIEQQTIIEDIVEIQVPIDIFYGTLDQLLVVYNIRQLKAEHDVAIHGVRGADHDIGKRYAAAVAAFLLSSNFRR